MTWAQRTATCKWCEKPIEAGTPTISVFFWNKGEDGRRWNVKHFYHVTNAEGIHCWESQGLDYLKMNPYVAKSRGVVRKSLTDEQRTYRNLLLRRKGALDQRKRNLKAPYPDRALYEARIDAQITALMLEIEPYGGIPKGWLEELLA